MRTFLACLLLVAPAAWAALDSAPDTDIATEAQRTPAVTAAGVAYARVHRTLRSGVGVDEFVDAGGRVFALAWSGPFKPDLKRLLGRHFEPFRARGAERRGGPHSHLAVETGEAVVVSEGHMGAFEGRAWLPSRLPAGFDTQEMK